MSHVFTLGEHEHALALARTATGYCLHLGEARLDIALDMAADGRARLTIAGRQHDIVIASRGDALFIHLDGESHELRYRHPLERLAAQAAGGAADAVRAPMPGSIVSLAVAVGDAVSRGQTLLVMESMKMETTLLAPRDGVVAEIRYARAQSFERDALLLSLVPAAAAAGGRS